MRHGWGLNEEFKKYSPECEVFFAFCSSLAMRHGRGLNEELKKDSPECEVFFAYFLFQKKVGEEVLCI
jgi:hypothetical protein